MSNSKYQEALDYIVKNSCNKRVACNECDIQNICNSSAKSRVDNLQELVDKATPKRPILNKIWEDEDTKNIYDECGRINELLCVCSNCGESAIYDYEYNKRFKYCSNSGQRIDWSDIDGK